MLRVVVLCIWFRDGTCLLLLILVGVLVAGYWFVASGWFGVCYMSCGVLNWLGGLVGFNSVVFICFYMCLSAVVRVLC